MRTPSATYRLQLGPGLRFPDVRALVPYLDALGVTDLYLSPIFRARPGSTHGYDVIDPTSLNPELGTEEELAELSSELKRRGMGLVLDVVPNHMCISDSGNRWWSDVLENGPGSPFAPYFDIDWTPPKSELANKVLLPVLGEQYGRTLEAREIRVVFDAGAFFAEVYGRRLPLGPRSWTALLEPVAAELRGVLGDGDPHRVELESIVTALGYLPRSTETDPDRVRERRREKEVVKRRLAALAEASGAVLASIEGTIARFNGARGDPRSFDLLERLLADQVYRLCYWRVAADEINYRRFFDINELAAICVERPEVFASVHEGVFRLVKSGCVTGLRIDHVDGLFDPIAYLEAVRAAAPECYVVVEKILEGAERLHADWPVAGTTGYDFLNQLNGLFVKRSERRAFLELYARFAGRSRRFADIVNTSKKLIMLVAMASELHVLTCRLDRISEQHRWSRDFTRESLRFALREVVASFPVYRSYIRADDREVDPVDRARIGEAIEDAKRRNPATSASLFDFIADVLLLRDPDGITERARAERRELAMRFQQLTGPVMAKGLEDTAFYRYFPLASLNEVGGDPTAFGIGVSGFHERNRERAEAHPRSLLATTTHDTKRSEDVRARLNVLSEMPEQWFAAICRWHEVARAHKTRVLGRPAPDANDEYLLYQTLVGACPLDAAERPAFRERVKDYMIKAVREAKVHTSWIKPDLAYEGALRGLVDALLEDAPKNRFPDDFLRFLSEVAYHGALNGLAQVLLKVTSPGVPDLFQGAELWTLTLVDPDNRRPVDFAARARILADLDRRAEEGRAALAGELLSRWRDGAIKLYVTAAALRFRRGRRALFEAGRYTPVHVEGGHARHAVAFLRSTDQGDHALVATSRLMARLATSDEPPVGERAWGDTRLALPKGAPRRWRDVLTGEEVTGHVSEGEPDAGPTLPLSFVFGILPLALLEPVEGGPSEVM